MNILLANKFFHLNGGSERVFFQERFLLLGLGHKIIDFSMEDERNIPSPYSDFFVPNIDYHRTGGIHRKLQQAAAFIHSTVAVGNLEKLLRQEKPEIAHLHNIYHQLTPSIIPILKNHGVKVVMTMHDCKLVCPSYNALSGKLICTACLGRYFWKPFTTNCQGSRSRGLLLALEAFFHKWRRSYEAVDLFLSPSQFIADLTATRIPKEKIRVLRNGMDTNEFHPHWEDQGYGLYFGRLSREKGIDTLLQAHTAMPFSVPLKVVGTGPLEKTLRNAYPAAEFLGYKTGKELKDLVANSAFVVVPSEWYENCSMVVLEAMAMGKPVIGSRIGGIPEQVEDGKTGFLFEMGNAEELGRKMAALATDPELRQRLGRAARKKLEREYSLAAHGEGLLDIYSEVLMRDIRKN